MQPLLAIPLFAVSLAVTLTAAEVFAQRLDRIGFRLGLPEALLGLLTAVAADAPEITSAVVALARGEKNVGLGVVVGSNAFNLAAMLGVSALVAGAVTIGRNGLLLEGSVAAFVAVVATLLVLGVLPAAVAVVLLLLVLVPYVVLLTRGPDRLQAHESARSEDEAALWRLVALVPVAVALIVLGSTGMVESAIALSDRWNIPRVVVGVLVLAPVTSLPNAFTGLRLGRSGRGAALVSETLNSNTINLVFGVVVPALAIGVARATGFVDFSLGWMLAMTAVALVMLARPRGLARGGAALLFVLYAVFVVVEAFARG